MKKLTVLFVLNKLQNNINLYINWLMQNSAPLVFGKKILPTVINNKGGQWANDQKFFKELYLYIHPKYRKMPTGPMPSVQYLIHYQMAKATHISIEPVTSDTCEICFIQSLIIYYHFPNSVTLCFNEQA